MIDLGDGWVLSGTVMHKERCLPFTEERVLEHLLLHIDLTRRELLDTIVRCPNCTEIAQEDILKKARFICEGQ